MDTVTNECIQQKKQFKKYSLIVASAWTGLVALSMLWSYHQHRNEITELAKREARTAYYKDITYRLWNAKRGGVYAQIDEEVKPNPYLAHIPERDITTPSGRKLTLINPAYMTRLVHELGQKEYGIVSHITSLRPVRFENTPDQWEEKALKTFEQGVSEVSALAEIAGEPYLRFMRPLVTDINCLKCHGEHGYKAGDIRGGLSVAVPMKPIWQEMRRHLAYDFIGHSTLWLIGIGLIFWSAGRLSQKTAELLSGEQKMLRARAEWEKTFNIINDAITIHDIEFNILGANKTAEKILGISAEEMKTMKCFSCFHGTDAPPDECPGRQVLRTGEPATAECYEPHLDKHVEVKTYPRLDENGVIIGFVQVVRDITERKKQEEAHLRLQSQLLQSQKMESVGRLAGGIAHDFNNILTAIIGYSDLVLLGLGDDSPLKNPIRTIRDSGNKAAGLTRQLLAFSRKQVLEMKPVNLNEVIEDMSRMFMRVIGEDIKLELDLRQDARNIMADRSQIEQIIMNLVVNARDALPAGGEIIIETMPVELDTQYANTHQGVLPGQYIMLAVTDNGIGMTKEVQEKIFEPFFTMKGEGEGTGLGLAMVYGISRQHNGHVFVYSEPGKGTTFKIYLPVADRHKEETCEPEKEKDMPHGTETILVVDDEPSIKDLIKDVLRPLGYTVLETSDSAEGLNISNSYAGDIHLLLTDVVMPGMNGRKLADAVREKRPDIKVLFMSGYTDNVIAHHGVLDPGFSFIQKPLVPLTLAQKIRGVFDREK